ncbi:YdgA family protein [Edwardsiella anguillarum]|nr:YdgA family protein [Edwardsiella anguillarum]
MKADVARDLSRMDLAAEAKSLSIDAPNGGQRETLSLTGATFTTHSKMGKFGLNIGEQQIAAKHLSLSVDGKESAALDDLAMNASLKEGERTLDARVDYRLGALQIDGKAFGGGAMTLDLNGFDGHGVKTFADEYNAFISRQLSSGHSSDSAAYQQQLTSMLDAALPTLLSGNPRIDLKPVTWKNSAGSSQFDLSLSLGAPAKTEAAAALPLLQAVRTLDVSLNLSMPMATQIAANAAELEGYQADEAQKLAAQQVQGVSAMGQMFKLTTQQDNAIVSQLRYADGQVTLNGKQMTLAQFAGLFGVLGGMDSAPTGAQ